MGLSVVIVLHSVRVSLARWSIRRSRLDDRLNTLNRDGPGTVVVSPTLQAIVPGVPSGQLLWPRCMNLLSNTYPTSDELLRPQNKVATGTRNPNRRGVDEISETAWDGEIPGPYL